MDTVVAAILLLCVGVIGLLVMVVAQNRRIEQMSDWLSGCCKNFSDDKSDVWDQIELFQSKLDVYTNVQNSVLLNQSAIQNGINKSCEAAYEYSKGVYEVKKTQNELDKAFISLAKYNELVTNDLKELRTQASKQSDRLSEAFDSMEDYNERVIEDIQLIHEKVDKVLANQKDPKVKISEYLTQDAKDYFCLLERFDAYHFLVKENYGKEVADKYLNIVYNGRTDDVEDDSDEDQIEFDLDGQELPWDEGYEEKKKLEFEHTFDNYKEVCITSEPPSETFDDLIRRADMELKSEDLPAFNCDMSEIRNCVEDEIQESDRIVEEAKTMSSETTMTVPESVGLLIGRFGIKSPSKEISNMFAEQAKQISEHLYGSLGVPAELLEDVTDEECRDNIKGV